MSGNVRGRVDGVGPEPAPTDDARRLVRHADVLVDTDGRGRLTRLNEPDPETAAPRVFLARGRASTLVAFRADVPDDVASRLAAIANDLPSWDGRPTDERTLDRLRSAVRGWAGGVRESHGPAFRFTDIAAGSAPPDLVLIDEANAHLLEANYPYTRSVLDARRPVVGIVRDGVVVSACFSARRRPTAAEAGVHTMEAYRGLGLAVAVVRVWARAAQEAGMTPLYSTSWDNAASLGVAARLGLDAYADTVSFTDPETRPTA